VRGPGETRREGDGGKPPSPEQAAEEHVADHMWSLRPGTYLVVRVKKELNEPTYHVVAFCYKVNEDGTAIKKKVREQYAYPYVIARDYARDLRNVIDCREYFKESVRG